MLHRTLLGLLAIAAAVGFSGCGDLNSNPADSSSGTVEVSLSSLQAQMGYSVSGGIVAPAGDDWTTVVDGLVVGAIIVSQSTPYTADSIDEDTSSNIEDDAVNSIDFFSIIDLPTSSATVQFFIPPPSAGNWQLAAIGVTPTPSLLANLEDSNPLYYAFSSTFLSTNSIEGTTQTLTLRRACLTDEPPKGCAQYDTDFDPVVTPRVHIRGIYHVRNGLALTTDLYGGVRDVTTDAEASSAETSMTSAIAGGTILDGDELVVVTTHNPASIPAGCVVTDSPVYATAVAAIGTNGKPCYQIYTTPY
jgi:hypothetical protein